MRKSLLFIGCLFFIAGCSAKTEASILRRARPAVAGSSSAASVSSAKPVPLSSYKIPILVYHHIRKQEGWPKATWSWKMTVSPATFDKQMQWLNDHDYTAVDLNTFVKIIHGEMQGPTKPVVITFDDNNLNAYENGLPILKKYGQVAVFYIITDRLKNHATIDEDRIKDLVAQGMDIESHTVTHRVLSALSTQQIDDELTQSKKTLEALTGKLVLHLAYPGTAQNAAVRERAKLAGYVTATIMDPRPATEKDDLLKLPRIMMTDDTNLSKVLP
ncbi:MAG: icaB [Candidatus Peribacteria bacterium]|nr:icaB [Candidatus Peribacteria bacterium]